MGRVSKAPFVPPPDVAAMSTAALQALVYRHDPTLRCRMLPPDKFFASRAAEFARSLCAGCPILNECAELAIREEMHGYFDGVRGGLSPAERRVAVRQRKAAHVAPA